MEIELNTEPSVTVEYYKSKHNIALISTRDDEGPIFVALVYSPRISAVYERSLYFSRTKAYLTSVLNMVPVVGDSAYDPQIPEGPYTKYYVTDAMLNVDRTGRLFDNNNIYQAATSKDILEINNSMEQVSQPFSELSDSLSIQIVPFDRKEMTVLPLQGVVEATGTLHFPPLVFQFETNQFDQLIEQVRGMGYTTPPD